MLTQATPVIRTTARGVDDAGLVEDDANAVGSKPATGYLRPKFLTPPDQGGNTTLR